jgi:streptogramin lyase
MRPRIYSLVSLSSLVPVLFLSSLLPGLVGCSNGFASVAEAAPAESGSIKGTVHGGQQPVTGSHVYLMQASTENYNQASTSLLTSGDGTDGNGTYVLTDGGGGFNLAGKYTCTSTMQVYVVVLGGNPGLAPGTDNTSLSLMANLGSCPVTGTLAATVPDIEINEVTTVASVYAIAGYMTGTFQVSSSNTALAAVGLANAFKTTGNLVNIVNGTAYTTTPAGNGTVEQSKIYSLANMLAACVNSTGVVAPASGSGSTAVAATPCYTLFSNAKNGTITPSDTVSAMLNIALNPGVHIAALFNLGSGAGAPFQPTLGSAPKDMTLSIVFAVPGMGNPTANNTHPHDIAIDGQGNVWSANDLNNTLGEASTLGVPMSGLTGFIGNGMNSPANVAIDASGQVYVANFGASTVSVFTPLGTPRLLKPILTAGLNPKDLAVDTQSDIWITNFGSSSVSGFSSTGTQLAGSPLTGNGLNQPAGIAVQPNGYIWITDSKSKSIIGFTASGGVVPGSPFALSDEVAPFGIAIDGTGDIWSTDQSTGIFVTDSTGTPILNDPFYANNSYSNAVAIDGAGQAWITDRGLLYLNVLNASGAILSGVSGFHTGPLAADSIAIDGSGNVWFTPVNTTTLASDNTIREMIGAAAPVITPIAVGVAGNTLATRP